LIAALGPTAEARGGGSTVSGTWTWTNTGGTVLDLAGDGQVHNGTETSVWTGTFEGRSSDIYQMIQASPSTGPFGPGYGTQTNVFTGKVGGNRGTMIMYVTYWWPAGEARSYTGTWLILTGTGGLTGLSGGGTWEGGGGAATYTGTISLAQ
jgi:hypothetical protein